MNKLFNYDKAVNSILFSLTRLGGVTDMHKLYKILYFADQRHLSLYGRSITGDVYIAMQFGPVGWEAYVDYIADRQNLKSAFL